MKNKYLILVVLLSVLPILPFFISSELPHTHDGFVHLARLAAYFKALEDGSIPVRIAGYLNYGYGLPLFNFIYHLPYWIGSIFILVGFGLVNAFKISITLSFILSALFMFLFSREYFGDDRKAFLVTIFYQFVPFRLVELLIRGSYGEVYTYTFIPLVLYGLTLLQKKISIKSITITSVSVFLLVVSHNSVALLFFGTACLFVLLSSRSIKKAIISFAALFYGVVLSAFYWIPAMLEHKYTYGNLFMEKLYLDNFPPLQNFLIPNFNNNEALQIGGISTYFGFFQIIAISLGIYFVFQKRVKDKTKRIFYFSFILLMLSLFFMLPISKFIWGAEFGSYLRQFQFPWRFLALVVLASAILSVSFFELPKRFTKFFIPVVILTIFSTLFFWKASLGYDKIDENYYWNFPLNTTYYGETDLVWSAGPAKGYPQERVEFISLGGTISGLKKKNSNLTFQTSTTQSAQLVTHIQYYPGWNVYVNGVKAEVQYQDPNHRGEMVFQIPGGTSYVEIKFEENKLRLISDLLSILGFIFLIPLALIARKFE